MNALDGTILVPIPAGETAIGSPDDVGEENEHPGFTASLPGFYLALHPVTYAQYARYAAEATTEKRDTDRFREEFADPALADHPVTDINWDEAGAYCAWAGVRLPTELEWERAARGGAEGRTYPWGDAWDPALCHNSVGEFTMERCGVWEYPGGRSADGLFQMAGNVPEYCRDLYVEDVYARYASGDLAAPKLVGDMTPEAPREDCVLRGGDVGGAFDGYFRCARRDHWPIRHRSGNGLRVAMDMR